MGSAALPFEAQPLALLFAMMVRRGVDSLMHDEAGSIRSQPMPFQSLPFLPDLAEILRPWLTVTTADDSTPSAINCESSSSPNEKTPVLQGFEDDCGLVRIAENQEPPFGLEPKTYALRKRRPASVTTKPDEGLQPVQVAGCTNGCTRKPENDRGCTPAESATEPVDSELSKVIGAWPTLPVHLKAAVMALVATVQNSSR